MTFLVIFCTWVGTGGKMVSAVTHGFHLGSLTGHGVAAPFGASLAHRALEEIESRQVDGSATAYASQPPGPEGGPKSKRHLQLLARQRREAAPVQEGRALTADPPTSADTGALTYVGGEAMDEFLLQYEVFQQWAEEQGVGYNPAYVVESMELPDVSKITNVVLLQLFTMFSGVVGSLFGMFATGYYLTELGFHQESAFVILLVNLVLALGVVSTLGAVALEQKLIQSALIFLNKRKSQKALTAQSDFLYAHPDGYLDMVRYEQNKITEMLADKRGQRESLRQQIVQTTTERDRCDDREIFPDSAVAEQVKARLQDRIAGLEAELEQFDRHVLAPLEKATGLFDSQLEEAGDLVRRIKAAKEGQRILAGLSEETEGVAAEEVMAIEALVEGISASVGQVLVLADDDTQRLRADVEVEASDL